jgi:hypothetical protein
MAQNIRRRRFSRWVAPLAMGILLAVLLVWWFWPHRVVEVGWWRFEEAKDGVVRDASGFRNDGHITGTVEHTRDAPLGNAFNFSGTGYITGESPGAGFPTESASFSVTAWLRVSKAPDKHTGGAIFHFGSAGEQPRSNAHLFLTESGVACLGWGYGYESACGTKSVADNAWHHLAATFSNAERMMMVYLDGAEYARSMVSEAPDVGHGNPWMIGSYQTGDTLSPDRWPRFAFSTDA